MRVAYADPPYPGQARKHYSHDPRCAEVNHPILIGHLCEYFDCWALSTSSSALQYVLELCPAGVRIGAWVKPFASFKPGVNPAYTWEPVILWNGRNRGRDVPTTKDHLIENITLKKGLAGAKPRVFWWWLFDYMGLTPDDEFVDVFPGTDEGIRQWEMWRNHQNGLVEQFGLFEIAT